MPLVLSPVVRRLRCLAVFAALAVSSVLPAATLLVRDAAEFNALPSLNAGDVVLLQAGVYGALEKTLISTIADDATAIANPIHVVAATPGAVQVAAPSRITLRGRGIVLAGLDFGPGSGMRDNASTSPAWIIRTDIDSRHMRISHVRFDHCSQGDNYGNWILLSGFNHRVEHCSFVGQNEPISGAVLSAVRSVAEAGIETRRNHVIAYNYFGPRECSLSDNGYETIRIGDSGSQAHDMGVLVEHNVFYRSIWRSDGVRPNEPEIISNKSAGNVFRYNTFLESYGQITLRHGDRCVVEGNFVFGSGFYDGTGIALNPAGNLYQSGVRVIGQDHIVRNNYFVNLRGTGERAAVAVYAGYPGFNDGNGSGGDATYEAAHGLQLYHNTFIACRELRFGAAPRVEMTEQPEGVAVFNNVWQGSGLGAALGADPGFGLGGSGGNYLFDATGNFGWTGLAGVYSTTVSPDVTDPFEHYFIPTSASPLLDAADGAVVATDDIRGAARPAQDRDIGSFERESSGGINRPLLRNEVGPEFDGGPEGAYPQPPGLALTIATSALRDLRTTKPYLELLEAAGGTAPYSWALDSGALPDGLALDPAGTISGTPTTAGEFTLALRVTDAADVSTVQSFTIVVTINSVPAIVPEALPSGTVNDIYAAEIASSGGDAPFSWTLVSGALPPGLSLGQLTTSAASLSGTPTAVGDFSFTLQVEDVDGDASLQAFELSIAPFLPSLPVIITQPIARNVGAGDSVDFVVVAAGSAPLSYQWRKDGLDLPGETADVLTLSAVAPADAGSYAVRVTNPNGSVLSEAVALTVTTAMQEVFLDDRLDDGERLTQTLPGTARWHGNNSSVLGVSGNALSIAANGNGLAYFADTPRTLAVGESLLTTFKIAFDGTAFPASNDVLRVSLLNSHGTSTDRNAIVTPNRIAADGYSSSTVAFRNNSGYMAGAAINPSTAGTLRFFSRNYEATNTISGTASHTTLAPLGGSGGFGFSPGVFYTCTFSVRRATATSTVLTLTFTGTFANGSTGTWSQTITDNSGQPTYAFDMLVFFVGTGGGLTGARVDDIRVGAGVPATTPEITMQPEGRAAGIGATVTFAAAAAGDPAPTYQWKKDGVDLPGATGAALTLSAITLADAGAYTFVATNAGGSVSSNPATLIVYDPFAPALAFGGVDLVAANQNMLRLNSGAVAFTDTSPVSPVSGYTGPAFFGGAFVSGGAVIDQWNVFNDNANGDSLRFRIAAGVPMGGRGVGIFLWPREVFANPYDSEVAVNLSAGDATLSCTGRRFGSGVTSELRFLVQAADGGYYVSAAQPGGIPANFGTVTLSNPAGATWFDYDPFTDTIGVVPVAPDLSAVETAGVRLRADKTGSDGGAITVALTEFEIFAGSGLPAIGGTGVAFGVVGKAFHSAVNANNEPTGFVFNALPPGLSGDTVTGELSGTPTIAGNFTATVQATNAVGAGPVAELVFSIAAASEMDIPDDGLVANYEFNGNANDLANNRGGIVHGATLTADRFGRAERAYLFNGTTDYIEVADDDDYSVSTTGEFSISVWMKPATLTFPVFDGSGYVNYLGKGESGDHEWTFRMYNETTTDTPPRPNRTSFYVFDIEGGKGNGTYVEEPLVANGWIHFVAVVKTGPADDYPNSNYIKWYKNGALVDTKPVDGSPFPGIVPANGTAPLRIGTRNRTSYFQGTIDDLRIYNRVLSPTEVQYLRLENPDGPVTSNQPPTDIQLSATMLELLAANAGATVGALASVDPDEADEHTYALVPGAGAAANGSFAISDGSLVVGSTALAAGNYPIRLRTTDAGGLFFEKQFTISVIDTTPVPPAIGTGPQSQAVLEGGSVTFTANASGYPAPALQWRRNGTDLDGATGPTLMLANVSESDEGDYTVVATNAHGVATSAPAQLLVYPASARSLAFGGTTLVASNQNLLRLSGGTAAFDEQVPITPASGYAGQKVYGGAFVQSGGAVDQWNVFNDNANGDSLRFRLATPAQNAGAAGLFLWRREDFAGPYNADAIVNLAAPDSVLSYTGRRFGSQIAGEVRFVVQTGDGGYFITEPRGAIPVDFATVTLIDPASATWRSYTPASDAIGVETVSPNLTSILAAGVRLQVTKTGTGGASITVALSGFTVVSGTEKIAPTLAWATPAPIVYGTPLSVLQLNAIATGSGGAAVSGTFVYSPASGAVLEAGENQVLSVTFVPEGTDADIYTSATAATLLTVEPAPVVIAFSGETQFYDGAAKPISVTTVPEGVAVNVTYNGSPDAPVFPGAYEVVATLQSANHMGSATTTLEIVVANVVRHGPTVNGGVDGSLQVLLPENITLNGSGWISGDLLVPGLPSVQQNGQPTLAGVRDAAGAATPSSHRITLNHGALLRYLVRRVDAAVLPTVPAPEQPVGTRNVTLNTAGQSAGDFATLRNLTLNQHAGSVAIPAGTYGALVANGGARFVLGAPGATEPAHYALQNLTLNGGAAIDVVGPVVITLANGANFNGTLGDAARPEWLTLRLASGGVTLNAGANLHGHVVAPNGTVTINSQASLRGSVAADRLTINSGGELEGGDF